MNTPIYGHTNQESAYVVEDYPYGFKLRCTIRYWLEYKASKGYRFVSQTLNPKNGKWNAVKCSTYTELAACMFLDEKSHVHWTGVGIHSTLEQLKLFAETYPGANNELLKRIILAKEKRAQ